MYRFMFFALFPILFFFSNVDSNPIAAASKLALAPMDNGGISTNLANNEWEQAEGTHTNRHQSDEEIGLKGFHRVSGGPQLEQSIEKRNKRAAPEEQMKKYCRYLIMLHLPTAHQCKAYQAGLCKIVDGVAHCPGKEAGLANQDISAGPALEAEGSSGNSNGPKTTEQTTNDFADLLITQSSSESAQGSNESDNEGM